MLDFITFNDAETSLATFKPPSDWQRIACDGVADDDGGYLYRYVPLFSLLPSYKEREKLFMRSVNMWNDPYEERLFRTKFCDDADGDEFHHPLLDHVYGTCFTTGYNHESQWRVYENAANGPIVLLTFKAKTLFETLSQQTRQFYIGAVHYFAQPNIDKQVKQLVEADQQAYKWHKKGEQSDELLKPLFIKRQAFSHEREVRLLTIDEAHKSGTLLAEVGNFMKLIRKVTISPFCSVEWQEAQKGILQNVFPSSKVSVSNLMRRYKSAPTITINEWRSM